MRTNNSIQFQNKCVSTNLCQISLRGILLRRKGRAHTLAMAEAHNRRKIPVELESFAHIDPSKTSLNVELISLQDISLEDVILGVLNESAVDLNSRTNKRKDKGFAIEWLFSVTLGYAGNHLQLYTDCLVWLKEYFPNCPVVHAVIHYDENEPHMHVIMVPLEGNRLPASKVLSFKGGYRSRINSLYAAVGEKHGLVSRAPLRGATKKAAADAIILACNRRGIPAFLMNIWTPLKTCILNNPDDFLVPFGISIEQLVSANSREISSEGVHHE